MTPLSGTMIPIQTVTVGANGQAAIQFNNIPQTYTDLIVRLSVRTNRSNTYEGGIGIGINGNESTGYTWRTIEAQGSSVSSNNTSYEADWISRVPASQTTAGVFSNIEIFIPNYTSSNPKSYFSSGSGENNSATGSLTFVAGLQSSTSAITSLRLADKANGLIVQHSTATLYGVKNYALTQIDSGAKASGGIVTSDANYYYHTFTTSGTFTPTQSLTADYLVIAGGAGGGTGNGGGGGGAGGFVYTSGDSLTSTSYVVTVGAGGSIATDGNNSAFRSSTALKGGKGGNSGGAGIGGSGTYGSGGGNGRDSGSSSGGAGTSGQGFAGGGPAIGNNANGGGGGGGAGGTGYPGKEDNSANNGGLGGIGISTYSSWGLATSTGENVNGTYYYAGGGGGSPVTGNALGGLGGGGRSATFNLSGSAATSGITASGGGGGGGGNTGNWSSVPGNGGSGVVIIRYAK